MGIQVTMTQHRRHGARQWIVFLAVLLSLLASAWVVWSLSSHRDVIPGTNAIQSDATVTVGLRTPPQSLDIRTHDDAPAKQALLGNVYETITSLSSHNQVRPGLASSWKVSDDGLVYTFTIRSNDVFSNGHPLDASDAVWSLQQAVNAKHPGYDQLGNLKSVANPNTNTLVITLGAPNPRLLRTLSSPVGIVFDPRANVDYATDAVGSGPFVISDYVPGSSITLKRNTRYPGTAAASSQVTLRYFQSDAALFKALHTDDIQMALPRTADIQSALNGDPTLKIAQGPSTTKVFIGYNTDSSSIYSDQRVRQATRYLIDAKAAVASQHDVATLLGGPIGTLEPGYEDLTGLFPHDAAKARSMLSYFSTRYLGTVVFLVPEEYQDLGNAIADQLQSDGPFTVQVQVVDHATLQQRLHEGKYTIALMTTGGSAGTNDASTFADADSVFRYTNADAQRQYAEALAATNNADYENRLKAYAKTVSRDAAADWLYEKEDRILVKAKLHGYESAMSDERLALQQLRMQ